jgi:hypothetical protein
VKYGVEMDSGVMIYIPSFIKTASGIQTLMEGIHRQTETPPERQEGDRISLL